MASNTSSRFGAMITSGHKTRRPGRKRGRDQQQKAFPATWSRRPGCKPGRSLREEALSKEERSLADRADGEFQGRAAFDGDRMSLEKRQVVHGSLQARGGQSCADRTAPTKVDPVTYHESAHCLRFSDLWYAVYSLKSPILDHSIHFQAFQMARNANGTTLWKNLNDGKTATLNAESHKFVTSDSKMSARYSSFHGDRLIPSFLDNPEVRLLIPQPVSVNMEHLT
uniref:Generative cell specific-1/HAP2 domain-containing protein n=1 Tax=Timema cristinae TaxID=61476 RepID=A0A7R9CR76_TIMCR|nr:unnamed protein product [Timema cristinae]